jgi:hypothetical protein
MGNRPVRPAWQSTSTHIRKVAKISQFERIDPAPDNLTLLKRKVDEFDQLEVSDNTAWSDAVAAISNSYYRRMFQGGIFDRLRFRYLVYGFDDETMATVQSELDAALP